ncbi:hypothetical protein [Streptomyces achromogenes]|uniref:hypothetical protein n=1 Tax=Streptomyces achromogenes TaxID=67255 RepID=UPI003426F820
MAKQRIPLQLSVQQAGRLRLLIRRHRAEETEYVNTRTAEEAESLTEEEGSPAWERAVARIRRAVRVEAAGHRPEWWPSLDVLMGEALEARLKLPDLAGPWPPLTNFERARLSLTGRWPACLSGLEHGTAERSFTLNVDLVLRLRTAAWRISEPILKELEEKNLTGPSRDLSEEARAERDRLAALLYPPSRIAREAVDKHWPIPLTTSANDTGG